MEIEGKTGTPERRTWVYVHRPQAYEMSCDRCGGTNLEWSEWAGMVWCYDCQVDTPGNAGIFDGPVAVEVLEMLGLSLDRIDLKTGKRMKPILSRDHVEYVEKEVEG